MTAELLVSLTGFIFGVALSVISPEELKPGKRYLLFFKDMLFALIVLFSSLSFIYFGSASYLALPLIYLLLYLALSRRIKYLEPVTYIFFITVYLLIPDNYLQGVLPALIFLYGLPAGSIFRLGIIERQEAKHLPKIKHARKKN